MTTTTETKLAIAKKATKAKKPGKPRSGLDAAHKVLTQSRRPMTCKAIVERMLAKGLWRTNGKTPEATLNAAMHREMRTKGEASRFVKAERGQFAAA